MQVSVQENITTAGFIRALCFVGCLLLHLSLVSGAALAWGGQTQALPSSRSIGWPLRVFHCLHVQISALARPENRGC